MNDSVDSTRTDEVESPTWTCDACNSTFQLSNKNRHLKSQGHLKRANLNIGADENTPSDTSSKTNERKSPHSPKDAIDCDLCNIIVQTDKWDAHEKSSAHIAAYRQKKKELAIPNDEPKRINLKEEQLKERARRLQEDKVLALMERKNPTSIVPNISHSNICVDIPACTLEEYLLADCKRYANYMQKEPRVGNPSVRATVFMLLDNIYATITTPGTTAPWRYDEYMLPANAAEWREDALWHRISDDTMRAAHEILS